jgi:ubiquinone/menaquinone biosynthesis C-methylase UbiE
MFGTQQGARPTPAIGRRTAMTTDAPRTYLPAAGRDWTLLFYDPLTTLMGAGRTRTTLLELAALRLRDRVLEIGCGTGSLLVRIKGAHPDVTVVGLDPDPKALARARSKARRAAAAVGLDQGFGDQLPYPDASFDRVFSSFMFHHLPMAEKEPTLREVRRVLKPGGRLILLDFAGPDSDPHGFLPRRLHASHRLADNAENRVLALMRAAGFNEARLIRQEALLLGHGRINYYEAS